MSEEYQIECQNKCTRYIQIYFQIMSYVGNYDRIMSGRGSLEVFCDSEKEAGKNYPRMSALAACSGLRTVSFCNSIAMGCIAWLLSAAICQESPVKAREGGHLTCVGNEAPLEQRQRAIDAINPLQQSNYHFVDLGAGHIQLLNLKNLRMSRQRWKFIIKLHLNEYMLCTRSIIQRPCV